MKFLQLWRKWDGNKRINFFCGLVLIVGAIVGLVLVVVRPLAEEDRIWGVVGIVFFAVVGVVLISAPTKPND